MQRIGIFSHISINACKLYCNRAAPFQMQITSLWQRLFCLFEKIESRKIMQINWLFCVQLKWSMCHFHRKLFFRLLIHWKLCSHANQQQQSTRCMHISLFCCEWFVDSLTALVVLTGVLAYFCCNKKGFPTFAAHLFSDGVESEWDCKGKRWKIDW